MEGVIFIRKFKVYFFFWTEFFPNMQNDMVFCVFGIAEFGGIYFCVEKLQFLFSLKIIAI
jgi:hypothetical protein